MEEEQQIPPQDQDERQKEFDNKEFDEPNPGPEHSERPPPDQHGGDRRDEFRGGYHDGPGYNDYDGPPRFHGPRGPGPRGYGPPMRGPR